MVSDGPGYDAQFKVLISDYSVDEITHPKEAELGKGLLALVSKVGQDRDGWVDAGDLQGAGALQHPRREDRAHPVAAHADADPRGGD